MSHDLTASINAMGRKVGLHLIISSNSFYDSLIDLDELFRIAGPIISIDMTGFELVWPPDLSKWSCQTAKTAPPCWDDVSY
jgi:hypothetical protein